MTILNNQDSEPLISFGNKQELLFCKFIRILKAKAFFSSFYPLILSLKVRCDLQAQEKLAYYIRKVLKGQLFV